MLTYEAMGLDQADGPKPAFVLMHGYGADERDLLPVVRESGLDVITISLRGPLKMGPGYAWYPIDEPGAFHRDRFEESMDEVDTFLDQLGAEFPTIDMTRIILGGFSQGGILAASLTSRRGGRGLLGTVVMSGYLPSHVAPPSFDHYPIFWGHGRRDAVVPFAWGERGAAALRSAGASVEFHGYSEGHGIALEEVEDLARWGRRQLADT